MIETWVSNIHINFKYVFQLYTVHQLLSYLKRNHKLKLK